MIKGYIKQFETLGLHDGPGVRVVIFMQGCPLRCSYCHNPEMWEFQNAKEYTSQEVLEFVKRYQNYFGKEGGVTFSGGEPLAQSEFLLECLKLLKDNNINVALDTSGAITNEYTNEILSLVDLVILDIKATSETEYQAITKQKIAKVNEFLKICQEQNKKLWLRQVIVPSINDDYNHIKDLVKFIKPLKNILKVELLPYHTMAISKYETLGINYELEGLNALTSNELKELQNYLDQELSQN